MTEQPLADRPTAPPFTSGMRVLGGVVTAFERLSAQSGRRRPPVRPVIREQSLVVTAVQPEAEDVVSLLLERSDRAPLSAWQPGAHLDVLLPSGRLRQYSLCGDPRDPAYRIAVRRIPDSGAGSVEAHALRPGDRVTVRGPRNAFPFLAVERYLFVAGGIGITPILPMVRDAARRGADWTLVYTGRTRASMPFLDELVALDTGSLDTGSLDTGSLDTGSLDTGRVRIRPDDECGRRDPQTVLAAAPTAAALYCCGPPPMLAAIRAQLPSDRIATFHAERFSAPPVVGGEPFEIEFAGTGQVVPVAADQSALDAIRRVRPDVAYSCQQGFCGTCPVRVVSGTIEHHDRCLTPGARSNRMAICVSRGIGRIEVEL